MAPREVCTLPQMSRAANLTLLALVALVGALVLASPAGAQEDGVILDPDSAAGKEYAVPFGRARNEAAGDRAGGRPRSDRDASPFGAGISPAGRRADGRAGSDIASRGSAEAGPDSGPGGPGRSGDGPGGRSGKPLATAEDLGSGGRSSTAVTGGIAVAVLVAAGLLALAFRRSSERPAG